MTQKIEKKYRYGHASSFNTFQQNIARCQKWETKYPLQAVLKLTKLNK